MNRIIFRINLSSHPSIQLFLLLRIPHIGFDERHSDSVKFIIDFILRKGIGFLLLMLLTSLSMAGTIEYIQVGSE